MYLVQHSAKATACLWERSFYHPARQFLEATFCSCDDLRASVGVLESCQIAEDGVVTLDLEVTLLKLARSHIYA